MIRKTRNDVDVEDKVPFTSKSPTYLTPEQRDALTQIPVDLSDREIARYYTLTQKDLELINQRRRHHNRLGFAVQLAVLRFPGRPLRDLAGGLPACWRRLPIKCKFPLPPFPGMEIEIIRSMSTWMRSGRHTTSVNVDGRSISGLRASCCRWPWRATARSF